MQFSFIEWLNQLTDSEFMPHGMCYLWQPATLWSNVLGDGVTALSYFLIPGLLVYFVQKKENLEFKGVFWAFAAFIISCGVVHVIGMVNVWIPLYNLSGFLKIVMATVSLGTVILLYLKLPEALTIPTPGEIEIVNQQLRGEIAQKESLQKELEKKAEELQNTIDALKEVQSIAKIGTWEVDIEEMQCTWSDEVYRIHEVPQGTPINVEDGINFYREDYRPIIEKAVNKGISEDASWDEVCVLVTQNKREVWVRAIGHPKYENGELKKLHGLFMDINDQKIATDKLELRERQLQLFVQQAPVAVAMVDHEMKYITASNKWYKDYGIEGKKIIGRSHYDIFPEIRKMKEWLEIHKNALNGEGMSREKDRFARADGSIQWISWKIIPWYMNPGEIGGIIMYTSDITNQIQYQEKLENLNEVLEDQVQKRTEELNNANKELEAFSYSVSHDLRAPLRSINGFADILEEDYKEVLDDEGKRLIGIIKSSGVKMGQLIDDILSFSRLGRKALQKTDVDMNLVFNEVMRELDKGESEFKLAKLHSVKGDLSLLKQVVTNLVSNAVKYSSQENKSVVKIESTQKDNTIIFSIQDNGTGFDMKYHDKLFGVFQRLHSEKEFEGTGVGLAIVKRIITKHDGEIWAESEIGKGSTFYFSLPLT